MSFSLPQAQSIAISRKGSFQKVMDDRFILLDKRDDRVRRAGRGCIYAVADGVGSTIEGFAAAEVACENLRIFFTSSFPPSEDLLIDLAESGDAEIRLITAGASTLSGIWLTEETVRIFSIGDSPVYRIRDGLLTKITRAPARRGLKKYMGMGTEVRYALELYSLEYEPGDVYLIMTDGMSMALGEKGLIEFFGDADPDDALQERLRHHLETLKPEDDATVIALRLV